MAHTKATGSTQNNRDSNPKYLGVKLFAGETAKKGSIIIRQRGTHFIAGENTSIGKDHTIFAIAPGTIKFSDVRKTRFDGRSKRIKKVSIVA